MSFGKGSQHIRKNNVLSIPIGFDGVGSETHPNPDMASSTERKILSILNKETETLIIDKSKSKWKLYLNTIINLLNNKEKKSKPTRQSKIAKIRAKLFKWWIRDTTDTIKELIGFVTIHGLLGAPVIISILTISGLNVPLITFIRESKILLTLIYIVGFGSAYYLFDDVNKLLKETWGKKK